MRVHLLEEIDPAWPIETFARAFPARSGSFLLDGGGAPTGKGELARYAIFGAEPVLTFRASRLARRRRTGALAARVTVSDASGTTSGEVDDAFAALRTQLAEHAFDDFVGRPLPLMAGAVGYVGYEAGQMLERLPCATRPGTGMPDIAFGIHRWVVGRCNETRRAWLSVVGDDRADAEATRRRVLRAIESLAAAEPRSASDAPHASDAPVRAATLPHDLEALAELAAVLGLRESVSREAYEARVDEAKRAIFAGDAFEICLTRMTEAPFEGDPWTLFRALRALSPAPFAAMLDLPEGAVISSSPERFLRLDAHRVAETRPIKGTRPRGLTPDEDARLARDLATSEKDRAENAMIVDLSRNDLGKVCRFGSVSAPELYAVEPYATVHQLVSTVRGHLDEGRDAIDLVCASFPPGSMTGAPKIEAMSHIERLEPTERGVYAGALGYLDLDGTMDLSVVIRTIVVREGRASFHVGGAIVSDSEPGAEHDETLHKSRALVAALAGCA